jgi:RNA polymerase sigma-70 factor (ECF subfamily)
MAHPSTDAEPSADLDQCSDVDLMDRAKTGAPEAFVCLIRRYQTPLLNFFRRMGVYTDAEDMAQDTFVRLFRYRSRYRPSAKFTTFLYLMARQVWIDSLRKRRRREDFLRRWEENRADDPEASGAPETRRPDAAGALDRLPPRMREVVVLNIYQGLKYEEIARVLCIPEGTVKSRMFHALAKLREMLDAESRRPQ